jgi:hypothetical protein
MADPKLEGDFIHEFLLRKRLAFHRGKLNALQEPPVDAKSAPSAKHTASRTYMEGAGEIDGGAEIERPASQLTVI